MKILALEFSSAQRSVAIVQSAGEGAVPSAHEVVESSGPSSNAVGMIEAALRASQIEREEVECVAVGLGPGSYSGIRSAIALAQGWQLAREVSLTGISSVECLAAQALASGAAGRVAIVINAQRGEFYLARYDLSAGAARELQPLKISTKSDVLACRDAGDTLFGPEITEWFPQSEALFPSAAAVARLALQRSETVAGELLQPIYLRETQFVKAAPPRFSAS